MLRAGLFRAASPPTAWWAAVLLFVGLAATPAFATQAGAATPRAQSGGSPPVGSPPGGSPDSGSPAGGSPASGLVPAPLAFAWGVVAEPAEEGSLAPGGVAEHLEFLQAHGWPVVLPGEAAAAVTGHAPVVVLTFDDPASAHRYVLPLLDLYRLPAVVTVGPGQAADPALAAVLQELAASEWVELAPRVEAAETTGAAERVPRCAPAGAAGDAARDDIERLRRSLAGQVERLRALTGRAPRSVAWEPGTWSGAGERVAARLGLAVQLPTFTGTPPVLEPALGPLGGWGRVPRHRLPPGAGIWALVQGAARWDPQDHPVRFVALDAAAICSGGAAERTGRVLAVVDRLDLNGLLLRAGDAPGVAAGDVAAVAAAARHAGVRQVMLEVPADAARAAALTRAVRPDVVLLPAAANPGGVAAAREDGGIAVVAGGEVGDAVRDAYPAVRLAVRDPAANGAFTLAPSAPGRSPVRGLTVAAASSGALDPEAANAEAAVRAAAGWHWIGLPLDLAETALVRSPHALAAFALPKGP